jgi:hypothetical protein
VEAKRRTGVNFAFTGRKRRFMPAKICENRQSGFARGDRLNNNKISNKKQRTEAAAAMLLG